MKCKNTKENNLVRMIRIDTKIPTTNTNTDTERYIQTYKYCKTHTHTHTKRQIDTLTKLEAVEQVWKFVDNVGN